MSTPTQASLLYYALAGTTGGLIVASWHGYKDTPWENFHPKRFIRSPIIGGFIGMLLYHLSSINIIGIDNLGLIALSAVALERLVGEFLKGFIKPEIHAEYISVFNQYKFPYKNYLIKLPAGIIVYFLASMLLAYYINLSNILSQTITNKIIFGSITGFIAGITIAIGGAIKDSPAEGFKPKKFLRSPLAGIAGGIIISYFTKTPDLIIISAMGFERISVEFHKTFISTDPRGIFEGKKPRYTKWFKKRKIFYASYIFGVSLSALLLILS